jgi:hypothetical protein
MTTRIRGAKPGTPRYSLRMWSAYPKAGPFFWYYGFKRVALAHARALRNCSRWELWDLKTNRMIDGHGITTPSEPTAEARQRITLVERRERDVREGKFA